MYESNKLVHFMGKIKPLYKGEGKSLATDLDDFTISVYGACVKAAAPSGMLDILDLTTNSVDKVFDQELNRDLFLGLFDATEPKSHARQLVRRYRHEKDGRRAWLAINKMNMALTPARRSTIREKIEEAVIDTTKEPEKQFTALMDQIQLLQDSCGEPLGQSALQDYIIRFINVKNEFYKDVVRKLQRDIEKGRFNTATVIKELTYTFDNAAVRHRGRPQPDAEDVDSHGARHKETRDRHRAGSAAIQQAPAKAGGGKAQHPCVVCESHGIADAYHMYRDCPKLQAARQQRAQQERGGPPRDTPAKGKSAKAAKGSKRDRRKGGARRALPPADDESIPDSDYDFIDNLDTLGASMARPGTPPVMLNQGVPRGPLLAQATQRPKSGSSSRSGPSTRTGDTVNGIVLWLLDSGCWEHICGDATMFSTLDRTVKTTIELANKSTVTTEGLGSIHQLLRDDITGDWVHTEFVNVHYIPGAENLLSVRTLVERGFDGCVDFKHGILSRSGRRFKFSVQRGGYFLRTRSCPPGIRVKAPQAASGTPLLPAPPPPAPPVAARPVRDNSDWQFIKSEWSKYAPTLGAPGRTWQIDAFTDGVGPGAGNAQAVSESVCSKERPFQERSFAGMYVYGCPVFKERVIDEFLSKCNEDFLIDPANTAVLTILPYLPSASWWHRTRFYREVVRYPAGARIFTCPAAGTYDTEQLEPAGDEGGPDRVFISGTPWPVVMLFRDQHTPVRIDDPVKLHLRLGHLSAPYLTKVVDKGIETGLNVKREHLTAHAEICHCSSCNLAKAKKPGPHPRTSLSSRPEANFARVTSDLRGPISPTSIDGFNYLVHFTCIKTEWTAMYCIKAKKDATQRFREFRAHLRHHGDLPAHQILHVDNDKVLIMGDMKEYCEQQNVLIEPSLPYVALMGTHISGPLSSVLLT